MKHSLLRDPVALRAALDDGLDPNGLDRRGRTRLMGSTRSVGFDVLLDAGADPHVRTKYGEDALFFALDPGIFGRVSELQLRAARRLLDLGVAVDGHDILGNTTLMGAAGAGELAIVRTLVERGAPVTAETKEGNTALMNAASRGAVQVLTLLLEHGARLGHRNAKGRSAIDHAMRNRRDAAAVLLLRRGADLPANEHGWTALHDAAINGMPELIDALLEAGWDIEAPAGPAGITPLGAAAQRDRLACVERLLQRGANPNASGEGSTVLTVAARGVGPNAGACVRALLKAGADPSLAVDDVSPLELAMHPEVVEALGGDAASPPLEVLARARTGQGMDAVRPWLRREGPIHPTLVDALLLGAGVPAPLLGAPPGEIVRRGRDMAAILAEAARKERSLLRRLITRDTAAIWKCAFLDQQPGPDGYTTLRQDAAEEAPAIFDQLAAIWAEPPAEKLASPWFTGAKWLEALFALPLADPLRVEAGKSLLEGLRKHPGDNCHLSFGKPRPCDVPMLLDALRFSAARTSWAGVHRLPGRPADPGMMTTIGWVWNVLRYWDHDQPPTGFETLTDHDARLFVYGIETSGNPGDSAVLPALLEQLTVPDAARLARLLRGEIVIPERLPTDLPNALRLLDDLGVSKDEHPRRRRPRAGAILSRWPAEQIWLLEQLWDGWGQIASDLRVEELQGALEGMLARHAAEGYTASAAEAGLRDLRKIADLGSLRAVGDDEGDVFVIDASAELSEHGRPVLRVHGDHPLGCSIAAPTFGGFVALQSARIWARLRDRSDYLRDWAFETG